MKTLDEIRRHRAEDLERISLDESIPVPSELSGRVQEAIGRKDTLSAAHPSTRRYGASVFAVAASLALFALGAWFLHQERTPKDTFDDPLLAYAEVEKTFAKIAGTVSYGASKISESETAIDKLNYWK